MISDSGRPRTGSWRRAEQLLAATVLLWRLFASDPAGVWRDWAAVLAVFWLYSTFRQDSHEWPRVAVCGAAYLLALYFAGQAGHTLTALGLR